MRDKKSPRKFTYPVAPEGQKEQTPTYTTDREHVKQRAKRRVRVHLSSDPTEI